ncbi:MAG TPA: hypothetical protein VEB86_19095 [Chryseosolibacter sp.]|nr:hypothetical protein [Chryseosolibacter sp.]
MRLSAIVLSIFIASAVNAQVDSTQLYYSKAREAYKAGSYGEFYSIISRAYRLNPYHPALSYQAAVAASLTGRAEEAISMLRKTLHENAKADLTNPDLAAVARTPRFAELQNLQTRLLETVISSDTAFMIPDRTLHVESIAAGETYGIFYGASIHKAKIIRIDVHGRVSDFTSQSQDGLTSVFAVKVDRKKNILWACSSPMAEMEERPANAMSAVFMYDIGTKKLLRKFYPPGAAQREFIFGDLILDAAGNAYVSDSKNNHIFRVNESADTLELFYTASQFWNIQGITFDDKGKFLFIADYIKGIFRLDVKSKLLTRLEPKFEFSTKSIDGLIFHKKKLIAIQNYIQPMRVVAFTLGRDYRTLESCTLIDKAHPAFNEPTNGCLYGDTLYYVANSLWSGYTDDRRLKPADQLVNPVILKVDLGRVR